MYISFVMVIVLFEKELTELTIVYNLEKYNYC